ncbi:hypothetical protein PGUG_05615 [Meyerozyma guilliermondii ATCC 6260]|uniref:CN hydrolase domain-containing protein n=1 Tax=Meyerozyma guilliermondii (strain ATCC 6260 / CBS 566 / DSM 6381 / JCM 1539 / NBRC 10279 / NRRL Y-324) TaxID=294746 RepID=A5DQR4_PICGU|nr:uncharacterized protein PGUG_05615 [Meyerozyma guilliermondii ATCC 6260]EDK41517.1 hypothetical protein PGUG_05615 [Meyerozyma guilliermondii ATCC 6260]
MSLKVACGQMCSSSNLAANARVACKLIRLAYKEKAKVLFLPEASDYISRDAAHSMELANATNSEFLAPIQEEIRRIYNGVPLADEDSGLYVALGVHEPSHQLGDDVEGLNKVQNNHLWINNKGQIVHRYQKIHLFDVNIPNGPILQESKSVEAGKSLIKPFPINEKNLGKFKIGLNICYDIRFPETCISLRKNGANIITYPSAFTTKTGESHWELLGRARAVDSQCYVIMAAQCGEHDVYADKSGDFDGQKKTRISYGESIIISPWGDVLARCHKYSDSLSVDEDGDYYELCGAELSLEDLERIRTNMPLMDHRTEYDIVEGTRENRT